MTYYLYIAECADRSLYTGITTDLVRRLDEHNGVVAGGAKYTQTRRPIVMRYKESHPTRSAASKREYEIKKLTREEKCNLIAI